MLKVLITDDHTVVRKGLKKILADANGGFHVDEAGHGQEALARILRERYDLVLMDISMPGRGGLEVLREIKSHNPRLPVLVLSMHPEEEYAVRAFRAGASGYVTKDTAAEELLGAIRKVLSGGKYVSASLAENLACDLESDTGKPPHEALSDREYQVMRMIASGKTVKEIAQELSLSIKTVSTYRSRILEKMRLKNNAELTRYAFANRLVS